MTKAQELRQLRKSAGISMAQACRLCGEKYRTWQAWETDGKDGRSPRPLAFAWLNLLKELNK